MATNSSKQPSKRTESTTQKFVGFRFWAENSHFFE